MRAVHDAASAPGDHVVCSADHSVNGSPMQVLPQEDELPQSGRVVQHFDVGRNVDPAAS